MSTTTNHKCKYCDKQLQAHEVKSHEKECPKRPRSISVDQLQAIIDNGFIEPSFAWECPVCGRSVEMRDIHEYDSRLIKMCDDCLTKLKFILGKYSRE